MPLQEQRQLLETLDAEYNDKATYAMQRCVQTMFAGEPAGVPRIGTREAILNATREGVKAAWEYAVKHAQICQFTIGDGADDRFAQQLHPCGVRYKGGEKSANRQVWSKTGTVYECDGQ